MSHTDKDTPGWVRALTCTNAIEHHSWRCERFPHGLARPDLRTECDIDASVDLRNNNCFYYLGEPARSYTGQGPGRKRRHLLYFGPERSAVRDSLRNAVRDYNSHGDTDEEPPTRQTRRSDWYGCWWG